MLIVHVDVQVKPEFIEEFKQTCVANARGSLGEAGVLRFDVLQHHDDPTRFVLVEVFRDEDAPLAHKETPHYKAWREAVEPMMAAPRTSRRFTNVFPKQAGWTKPREGV
jgi:quinol monooxygenase YgiN